MYAVIYDLQGCACLENSHALKVINFVFSFFAVSDFEDEIKEFACFFRKGAALNECSGVEINPFAFAFCEV